MQPVNLNLSTKEIERLRQLYAAGKFEQFNYSISWEGSACGICIEEIPERLQRIRDEVERFQMQAQEDTAAFLAETCTVPQELQTPGANDKNLQYIARHLMMNATWGAFPFARHIEAELEVFQLLSHQLGRGRKYYLEHEDLTGKVGANLDNFMFFATHQELAQQLISMYPETLKLENAPSENNSRPGNS